MKETPRMKQVTIDITDRMKYKNLEEVMKQLTKLRQTILKDGISAKDVRFELSAVSDYDNSYTVKVAAEYDRPETADEARARKASVTSAKNRRILFVKEEAKKLGLKIKE